MNDGQMICKTFSLFASDWPVNPLIKFAELHPTKIRLGVYTPAVLQAWIGFGSDQDFSSLSAYTSSLKRDGSCSVLIGALHTKVVEPSVILEEYEIVWRRPQIALEDLYRAIGK